MFFADYFSRVEKTKSWLTERVQLVPQLMIVLSGGLDSFVAELQQTISIPSHEVPHFPVSRVEGHAGKLVFGTWKNIPLVVLQGRYHYYEGHDPQEVVFPYFVLHALGATTLITTNAVGGIRHDLEPGDILVVSDHLNMMGTNPLMGLAVQQATDQFTNMIHAYDQKLRVVAGKVAKHLKLELKDGVYAALPGPSYETPAEIKMLRTLGADAVGMSTVFEVIAANFLKMRVLAFACIANPAADRHGGIMKHSLVLEAMKTMAPDLVRLLQGVVEELGHS